MILAGTKKSLVLMRSPAEKGQKVLMLGDDYWLIMPSSQRPMRITPTQKLLGDASTGDIATLSWAGDYDGKIVGEEPCEEGGKERCTHLSLVSQRKGLTYAHIELWLAVGSAEPARADLYVQSDKLAKRAKFILDKIDGRRMVRDMVIFDQMRRAVKPRFAPQPQGTAGPDEWFNPMYLTRAEIRVMDALARLARLTPLALALACTTAIAVETEFSGAVRVLGEHADAKSHGPVSTGQHADASGARQPARRAFAQRPCRPDPCGGHALAVAEPPRQRPDRKPGQRTVLDRSGQ